MSRARRLSQAEIRELRRRAGVEPVRLPVTQEVVPANPTGVERTLGSVVIHGDPVAKARPRVFWNSKLNRMMAVTPPETVKAERQIAELVTLALGIRAPDPSGRYGVDATFYVGNRRRSDVDNFAKCLLDGCNGRVWVDDSQVYVANFRKDDSDLTHPRTELRIFVIE